MPTNLDPETFSSFKNELLLSEVRSIVGDAETGPATNWHDFDRFAKLRIDLLSIGQIGLAKQAMQIIIDAAIERPQFLPKYVELFKYKVNYELGLYGNKDSPFRNAVLCHAQFIFCQFTKGSNERIKNQKLMEHQIGSEALSKLELDRTEVEFERLRSVSYGIRISSFIGHLYNYDLLSTRIMNWCVYELIRDTNPVDGVDREPPFDEISLRCAIEMIKISGKKMDIAPDFNGKAYLDQTFEHLGNISHNCSRELREMITNLFELRENKWVEKEASKAENLSGNAVQQQKQSIQSTNSHITEAVVDQLKKVQAERDQLLQNNQDVSEKYEKAMMTDVALRSDEWIVAKREIARLNQDYATLKEDHAKCQKENELLKAQNEELLAKCEAVSSKRDQCDEMARELSRLKEEYKNVKEQLPESSLKEKQQKNVLDQLASAPAPFNKEVDDAKLLE